MQGKIGPCDEIYSHALHREKLQRSSSETSVFLKKLVDEVARFHALLTVALQQAFDRVPKVLRFEVLANLLQRVRELLLALDAERRLLPRAYDCDRDFECADFDRGTRIGAPPPILVRTV